MGLPKLGVASRYSPFYKEGLGLEELPSSQAANVERLGTRFAGFENGHHHNIDIGFMLDYYQRIKQDSA